MDVSRNKKLQAICRGYLKKLRYMARKHGLESFLANLLQENKRGECEATEKEVRALSRLCDDERVNRTDVPRLLNKSYRECNDDGTFDKVGKLRNVGIYSKVSTLLLKKD